MRLRGAQSRRRVLSISAVHAAAAAAAGFTSEVSLSSTSVKFQIPLNLLQKIRKIQRTFAKRYTFGRKRYTCLYLERCKKRVSLVDVEKCRKMRLRLQTNRRRYRRERAYVQFHSCSSARRARCAPRERRAPRGAAREAPRRVQERRDDLLHHELLVREQRPHLRSQFKISQNATEFLRS